MLKAKDKGYNAQEKTSSRQKKSKTFAKFQAFSKKMSSQILREVSGILQEEEKKKVMFLAHF